MDKQAFNPFLPSYEYIPDGEPHIFGDRIYLYGSHDRFNGRSFCMNDYVCWSASINDLSDWRFEGYIYHLKQDKKKYHSLVDKLYAPDVCKGKDGKYYLYYFVGYTSLIAVATSITPTGPFEFLAYVRYKDGKSIGSKKEPLQFDPSIFIDDDGKIYLYTGFAPNRPNIFMRGKKPTKHGPMCFELEDDMITVKGKYSYIGIPSNITSKGTEYENGHAFFEASSIRKFNGRYYFIYSSYLGHELCYATSDSPKGPFNYGGTLVSLGDIGLKGHNGIKSAVDFTGNTHGSVIKIKSHYYVFYHRQTNRNQFSRQACAEEIFMDENGHFKQAERTSCGLNNAPLLGRGTYEARIACNLIKKNGNRFYGVLKPRMRKEPYFTQLGKDREDNPNQYIANIHSGDIVGFKYFNMVDTHHIKIKIKGTAKGKVIITNSLKGDKVGEINISPSKRYKEFASSLEVKGKSALFFKFMGKGKFDFISFTLE